MNPPYKLLLGALLGLGMLGCSNLSPTPTSLRGEANARFSQAEELSKRELQDGGKTMTRTLWQAHLRAFETLLQKDKLDRPLQDYRKTLVADVKALENGGDGYALSIEGLSAFPEVFQRRYTTMLLAYQGAARCQLALGEPVRAAAYCQEAMEHSAKVALSPASRAFLERDTQALLQKALAAQGLTGKALIAKLNADLLGDYLVSPKAAQHFYADKSLIFSPTYLRRFDDLQEAVEKVNKARAVRADAEAAAIFGELNSLGLSALSLSSGLKSGDPALLMLANFEMADKVLESTDRLEKTLAKIDQEDQAMEAVGEAAAVNQLADRGMGKETPQILQGYVASVVKAGGSKMQGPADLLTSRLEAVTDSRGSGEKASEASLRSFAKALDAFQSKAAEVK